MVTYNYANRKGVGGEQQMAIDCNACYNGYTLDHSSKDFNSADAELDRIVDLGI